MRATLEDTSLVRLAGRFVWLELNFDNPANKSFLLEHKVAYTPSLYVLDPSDERATATHFGGLSLRDLNHFLDEGERGYRHAVRSPADEALARGDQALGRTQLADAEQAYREALGESRADWSERARCVASLVWTLSLDNQSQAAAELAASEAPHMKRDGTFANTVLAGTGDAQAGGDAPWAVAARAVLDTLTEPAVHASGVTRDVRFQLYQHLLHAAEMRHDSVTVERWAHTWLDELDSIHPAGDDERSALDVARVDAASNVEDCVRIIPALEASERAMPKNYNPSLRLAQALRGAGRARDAIAACDRGLQRSAGPLGRAWLLETKADALTALGDMAAARTTLEQALAAAHEIVTPRNRESNERMISARMEKLRGGK